MEFHLELPGGHVAYAVTTEHAWSDPITDSGASCAISGTGKQRTVIAPHRTDTITFRRSTPGPILDYALDDPAEASERWPLTLDAGAYDALGDEGRYHYHPRRGDSRDEAVVVDVSGTVPWPTDGAAARPVLPEGARWTPAAAWIAHFGFPTHDHLIPGHLSGIHAAAQRLIESQPNYVPILAGSSPRIERDVVKRVSFRFMYEDGRTTTEKVGRRTYQRPTWQTVHVDITVGPDMVGGDTMDEAIVAWQARLDDIAAQFPRPALVCAACSGVGFVPVMPESAS